MKIICVLIYGLFSTGYSQDLEEIRYNYSQALTNELVCKEMINKLINDSEPIRVAYLGAFQTVWAKHTFNPFEKLRTFKLGKANIEESVVRSPHDTEIRFIRLSVQLNAPKFLGYNNNIEEDKKLINLNSSTIKSHTVQMMLNECLKPQE